MPKAYSAPFDIENGSGGVGIIITREPICSQCMSDREVDDQINALQENLERLRPLMKVAVQKLQNAPLGLRTTSHE
ncbi:hypothetical protein [Pseudotabrizicola alkalilacus]|uniref:Uncharacterized protein n=1 Tax=Pseudotabrizicola alkalilacus TaxID=2305252 RepID=A0A411Z849_9RHOB|nr:hypothetical protein [Pseudotabrizicola alkalilacus]RGP39231.1 hypothetical protein D1012_03770 [Pseudotabrizicola alkalilacus]